jgi:hypothetical protein
MRCLWTEKRATAGRAWPLAPILSLAVGAVPRSTAGLYGEVWRPGASAHQAVEQHARQRQSAEHNSRGYQHDGQGEQDGVAGEEGHPGVPSREDPDHFAEDFKASMTP